VFADIELDRSLVTEPMGRRPLEVASTEGSHTVMLLWRSLLSKTCFALQCQNPVLAGAAGASHRDISQTKLVCENRGYWLCYGRRSVVCLSGAAAKQKLIIECQRVQGTCQAYCAQ